MTGGSNNGELVAITLCVSNASNSEHQATIPQPSESELQAAQSLPSVPGDGEQRAADPHPNHADTILNHDKQLRSRLRSLINDVQVRHLDSLERV